MVEELRTESKMLSDNPSIMPFQSPRIPAFDLTKSPAYYDGVLVELCERFDIPEFKERTNKAIAYVTAKKAQQEAVRLAKQKEATAAKISENSAYNRFLHALKLKNSSLEPLLQWERSMSTGELIETLQEFQHNANAHGLPLKEELISFGLRFLLEHVSAKIP